MISDVCLSVCEQDYCTSNQLISLKLDVMMAYQFEELITFGDSPVSDTDSGSLFHFCPHCGLGYFRRFISISDAVTD